MNKSFKMSFLGQDIILPKSIVDFHNNIGIVKTVCLQDKYYHEVLFGIVDNNYHELLPLILLNSVSKYSFASNGVILKTFNSFYTLYIEILDKTFKYNFLPFLDYELIDDNLLKVSNAFFIEMFAFYDILKKEVITPYFHDISDFYYDEDKKEYLALATYYMFIDENSYKQIITYINIKGNIVSPYIDCSTGIEYDQTMDFNNVLSMIRNNGVYTRK